MRFPTLAHWRATASQRQHFTGLLTQMVQAQHAGQVRWSNIAQKVAQSLGLAKPIAKVEPLTVVCSSAQERTVGHGMMEPVHLLRHPSYARGRVAFVVSPPDMQQGFKPAGLNLICLTAWPDPWSWCKGSSGRSGYCLASTICDSKTHCGDNILSAAECQTGATELGLSSSITLLEDEAQPTGCFFVEQVLMQRLDG